MQEPPKKKLKAADTAAAAAAASPLPLERIDVKYAGAHIADPSAALSPTKRQPPYVVRTLNCFFFICLQYPNSQSLRL